MSEQKQAAGQTPAPEKKPEKQRKSRWYAAARVLAAVLFHTVGPVAYEGLENLPQDGPCILIGNHQSWMDPVIVAAPIKKKEVTFLGKKELVGNRLVHHVLTDMHMIIVDRHNSDTEALRACVRAPRGGEILGISPEGTRHHGGTMEQLESGVGLIALRSGAPVVPVYIDGKYRLFHRNRCVVGAPIDYSDLRAEGVNRDTCQRLMERITGVYAGLRDRVKEK